MISEIVTWLKTMSEFWSLSKGLSRMWVMLVKPVFSMFKVEAFTVNNSPSRFYIVEEWRVTDESDSTQIRYSLDWSPISFNPVPCTVLCSMLIIGAVIPLVSLYSIPSMWTSETAEAMIKLIWLVTMRPPPRRTTDLMSRIWGFWEA